MNLFVFIGLMLFILVKDKLLKSIILSVILYGCLTEIENKEHFGNIDILDTFLEKSSLKKIVNKCCSKKEIELIKQKLDCIMNNKDTYSSLMDNASNIAPSDMSIISNLISQV